MKIYMGAISKSEPILTKLYTHHSRPKSFRCAKLRADRKIFRVFGAPFTLNRTKIYMGAISKSEPIFPNFNRIRPCAKFHPNRIINATCILLTKIHGQTDGRADGHA